MTILHVATPEAWAATVAADGISAEPFLHLCTDAQLAFVLGRHFAEQSGLLLLALDPAGLDVRWEASEPDMDPFPRLYGFAPASAFRETGRV